MYFRKNKIQFMKNYICSSYLYICCFAWIRADKVMNLS